MAATPITFPAYTTAISVGVMAGFLVATLYVLTKVVNRLMNHFMQKRIERALLRRRNVGSDTFRDENGYSWDLVLAFPIYASDDETTTQQRLYSTKYILSKLVEGGLEHRLFYNIRRNLVYCKVRAPRQRLMIEADRIDMQVEFDEKNLEELCRAGRPGLWGPLTIPDTSVETDIPPFRFIYGPFQYDPEANDIPAYLHSVFKRWTSLRLLGRASFSTPSPLREDSHINLLGPQVSEASPALVTDNASATAPSQQPSFKHTDKKIQDPDLDGFEVTEDLLVFKSTDRLKLLDSIINNRSGGGCGLDVDTLIKAKCLAGYLPLHDHVLLLSLEKEWLQLFQVPWRQNVDMAKNYFGERIGLFFVFLGHQTSWLIPLAVVGLGCWINVAVYNNDPNAVIMPYFAAFVSLWTTFFLSSYRRKEVSTALRWGMVGFEEKEVERPQFVGVEMKSPVSGKPFLYFSSAERLKRSLRSYGALLVALVIAVGVLALLLFLRVLIGLTPASVAVADVITSIFVSMQIELLNGHYLTAALQLNDYENHRTETDYEDALISKTFIFQFINSFGCLFYIGFCQPFSGRLDPCLSGNCYKELQTTLGSIFITRLLIGNFLKVTRPMWNSFLQSRQALLELTLGSSPVNAVGVGAGVGPGPGAGALSVDEATSSDVAKTEVSEIEKSFMLANFDPLLGTFEDYSNMSTQFGFMTMFVAAFPLTTLLALVNNYVEMRVNAWRLCQVCRRPKPRCAEDIGTWMQVFEIIGVAAVFVNAGLVCFTGKYLIKLSWPLRVWIFILMSTCTIL